MITGLSIFFRKHWDACLASVAASVFIYLFTRHSGIGISPDSVNYFSTATNIREHFSFTDFNGVPLADFPLGYPSFLAFCSFITGLSVLKLAPVLNCILFSGLIISTSIIIEGHKNVSRLYKTCILALLACSPCLLEIYAMLWSETLFLFLTVLFMVLLKHYFNSFSICRLLLVSFVVALAFVTRYAGVTVLAVALFMIMFHAEIPVRKKVIHLCLLCTVGSSLVIVNLVRNKLVAGHSTGVREKALRSIGDNLEQIGTTLSDWLPFTHGQGNWVTILFLVVFFFAVAILIFHLLQQQFFPSYKTIVACFFVVYAGFIILIASISRFEDLSSRLLSPLYIPFLITGSSWCVPVIRKSYGFRKLASLVFVLIVYAGFHYNHYQLNAAAWEGIKDAGMPGYAENPWQHSPAVALVKANKTQITSPVYSNANDAVYFLTGIHALALPHKEIQTEINAFLSRPSFTLIWFIDGDNPDLVSLEFIRQHWKLSSAKEAEGGGVYHFIK